MRRVLHFLGKVKDYVESCFNWEKPSRSIKAFFTYEVLVYNFQPCLVPLILLGLMFLYPLYATDIINDWFDPYSHLDDDSDDDDEDIEGQGDKKTISERYKALQDVTIFVQNTLGEVASLAERVKNVFDFSVPFMSWLAVGFLAGAVVVLYTVPLRLLLMVYGVNKFSKKILRPNHVPSSEILNFLSRVPNDPTLQKCSELSLFDQQLLRQEEEERQKRENSTSSKIVKRVSSFFHKDKDKRRESKEKEKDKDSNG
jgi:hypothetical protein